MGGSKRVKEPRQSEMLVAKRWHEVYRISIVACVAVCPHRNHVTIYTGGVALLKDSCYI